MTEYEDVFKYSKIYTIIRTERLFIYKNRQLKMKIRNLIFEVFHTKI